MPLVQTPSTVISDPRQFLHVIYGEAGVGKTSFCAQIPGHYFLSTQAGTKGLSVYGENIIDWPGFINKCVELKAARDSGFADQREITTIIIDTYDALWEMAANDAMLKEAFMVQGRLQKFKRVEDVEFGKAYARVNQIVLGVLRKLVLIGFGVITVAHHKERVVKWRGQEFTGIGLSVSESISKALEKEADAIGYFMIEEEVKKDDKGQVSSVEQGRYVYWQPTFLRLAKHRLENFPERLALPLGSGWSLYEKTFKEIAAKVGQ